MQGRFAESVGPFRESLSKLEGELGSEHSLLVVPLNDLATSLVKTGQMDEAGTVYERAIRSPQNLGSDDPTCGVLLGNYACVLRKLGRKDEAKEVAARSREISIASKRSNGVGSVIGIASLLEGH